MEVKRIFDLLPYYLENHPEQKVALAGKQDGAWREYSIQEYAEKVDKVSCALLELGIEPNDKVAVILNNRPEWNIMDMAVMQIGAIMVPIYPTISEGEYKYILNNCGAKFLILESLAVMNKIKNIMAETPSLKYVYTLIDRKEFPYFQQLVYLGTENYDKHIDKVHELGSKIDEHDCATIIYTSGTTGVPKGVMLSHSNLINNFKNFYKTVSDWSCRALSFLPVCHAYERILNYMYQFCGISIYYAESLATIAENMREIHPTMMCAVPRVLERFYDAIISSGKKMKGISRMIFFWAVRVGERYVITAEKRSFFYNIKLKIADKLVYSKIRAKIGADEFDIVVSGAASLSKKLSGFFSAIKMPVFEGYGLSETSPVIAVSTREKYGREVGSVGPALPGVEIKIGENEEICCRGHNVMLGYYNSPELTKEVIDEEGWFHTGDRGRFNEHGLLFITGRIKSLFKTSGGKYVNPEVIENKFNVSGFVDNIIVVGENQKFAGAIIIPSFAFLKGWCQKHKIEYTTPDEMIKNPDVLARYKKEVDKLNKDLADYEKVKSFRLVNDEWTIANGILTPTQKVKRKVVMERHKNLIDSMFQHE